MGNKFTRAKRAHGVGRTALVTGEGCTVPPAPNFGVAKTEVKIEHDEIPAEVTKKCGKGKRHWGKLRGLLTSRFGSIPEVQALLKNFEEENE